MRIYYAFKYQLKNNYKKKSIANTPFMRSKGVCLADHSAD